MVNESTRSRHTNVCVCVLEQLSLLFPSVHFVVDFDPKQADKRSVTRGAYNDARDIHNQARRWQQRARTRGKLTSRWNCDVSRVWSCPSRHTRRLVHFSSVPVATTRHTTHHYNLDKQSASQHGQLIPGWIIIADQANYRSIHPWIEIHFEWSIINNDYFAGNFKE